MSDLVRNSDHVAQARARLIEQYKDKPKILVIVDALARQVQEVEDAIFDVFVQSAIEDALGSQLDDLGDIVGEARQGVPDDEYRGFIRARIRVNRSSGKREELIQIVQFIQDDELGVAFDEYYPASIRIECEGAVELNALRIARMLLQAKAGGVALHFVYSKVARTSTLINGWSGGALGLTSSQCPGWSGTIPSGSGQLAGVFA